MHFSVALSRFIKSQVLHFHPPLSEGGRSPAAPQLNPPGVVVVVVEGAGSNPVKTGLEVDPPSLGATNENPDVVGVDEVGLDVPNESGPEGGAGIEKTFPELEPEDDTPGLGASQTVHFSLADAGFIRLQVPHFHPSVVVVGGINPAAPQLNPPGPEIAEVVVEVLPGPKTRGAEGGFGMENDGVADVFSAPGFGVSHTVHFSVADARFIKSQVPHFHPSSCFEGGFKPAAPQLNPPFVVGAVFVEGLGKTVNVEVAGVLTLVLGAALLELDGPGEVEERSQALSMGISSSTNPLTSFSALNSPELFPSLNVLLGIVNVSVGSSDMVIERTSAFASLGEVAAVGDTDAEEAVSSLSALILNRSLEGSLGADDLRPKKDLPPAVGEIIGADDEAPLRPAVCSWGVSPGSMTSEGRRNWLDCENGG